MLDAFDKDNAPKTTVFNWVNGETIMKNLDGEELKKWMADYSLGSLFQSGELDILAEETPAIEDKPAE